MVTKAPEGAWGLKEAARFLRIKPVNLSKLAREGLVPGVKQNERWRFWKPALEKYLSGEWKPS